MNGQRRFTRALKGCPSLADGWAAPPFSGTGQCGGLSFSCKRKCSEKQNKFPFKRVRPGKRRKTSSRPAALAADQKLDRKLLGADISFRFIYEFTEVKNITSSVVTVSASVMNVWPRNRERNIAFVIRERRLKPFSHDLLEATIMIIFSVLIVILVRYSVLA